MNPIFFVLFFHTGCHRHSESWTCQNMWGLPPKWWFYDIFRTNRCLGVPHFQTPFRHHLEWWRDQEMTPKKFINLMAKSLNVSEHISQNDLEMGQTPGIPPKVHWWMDGYSPNYDNCPSCRDPHLPCCSSSASASGFSSSSAAATWNLRKQTVGDRFQKAETGGTHGVANCEELMVNRC